MNRNIGSNRLPIVVAVVSAVAVLTAPWYPGSVSYYLLFQTACGLLATAAFLPPVSHGYAAFAAFLMLGFWVKVVLATIGMDPRLEPIGAFNASGEAWDQALAFSATGLVAGSVVGTGVFTMPAVLAGAVRIGEAGVPIVARPLVQSL